MNFRISVLLVFLFQLLFSCGVPTGNRVDAKNLKVHYLEGVKKNEAIDFAKYWRDNGFVGDEMQNIQLSLDNDVIIVKLIEKSLYHDETLTINEQANINQLERDLSDYVFDKKVSIQITDNTFTPLDKVSN